MNTVFFSVIIPCYNSSQFIEKALVSVCGQSYKNLEIIVSDDASSDDTVAVARAVLQRYKIGFQILENGHQGPAGTRNSGIAKASHDWIAFLDSDDYWLEDKLEHVKNSILSDQSINYVLHNEIYFDGNKEWPVNYVGRYDPSVHPFLALIRRNFLSPTSAVIHKSLFAKAGVFDVNLPSAEDYELWLRMSLLPEFNLCTLDKYLAYYWVRPGNMTSNVYLMLQCLLQIYDRYLPDIKRISPKPMTESRRFKGRIYSSSGLGFWRQRRYLQGLWYIMLGQCYWPRTDWLRKVLK